MSYEQSPEAPESPAGGEPPAVEPPASALTDSAFGRLAGVLFSPAATFASIRRRPTWLVAFLVMTLLAAAAQMVAVGKLDTSEVRDQVELALEKQGRTMSDEDLDDAVDLQMKFGTGCGLVFVPIGLLLVAVVFMVVLRMSGSELTFVQSLSTVVHAEMPLAVSALLAIPVLLGRTTPLGVTEAQNGILASNLSILAPEGASLVMTTLLASFDLFAIWVVALLAIGFAVVAGVSRAKAATVTVVLWLVWIVFKVGLAGLGQAFGGGAGG